jgi:inosine/xanthosine triphosphate pyrophosphatase family protein
VTAAGPPRLVLATANRAKGAELAALLDGLGYAIDTLASHPAVTLPPEGATSYADNAGGGRHGVRGGR